MADTFNKRFDVSDVFVSPYEANKHYNIISASFKNYNITFNIGELANNIPKNQYTSENLLYQIG